MERFIDTPLLELDDLHVVTFLKEIAICYSLDYETERDLNQTIIGFLLGASKQKSVTQFKKKDSFSKINKKNIFNILDYQILNDKINIYDGTDLYLLFEELAERQFKHPEDIRNKKIIDLFNSLVCKKVPKKRVDPLTDKIPIYD